MWLCVGISPLWFGLQTWSKCQKTHSKSCSLHLKKKFLVGVFFFVSDVISGRLFGQLGQIHLALGAKRWMVVFR